MNDLFKSLVYDVIVKAALKRLLSWSPLLSWGPVAAVISHYVWKFADTTYEIGKEHFVGGVIYYRNQEAQKKFDEAYIALKILELESAPPEVINEHIKAAQETLADLVVVKPGIV